MKTSRKDRIYDVRERSSEDLPVGLISMDECHIVDKIVLKPNTTTTTLNYEIK